MFANASTASQEQLYPPQELCTLLAQTHKSFSLKAPAEFCAREL